MWTPSVHSSAFLSYVIEMASSKSLASGGSIVKTKLSDRSSRESADSCASRSKTLAASPASDYFRRQGWCTFCDDPIGIETRHWVGTERLLFGNDYPHHEGSWPNTEEVIQRTMGGLGDEERRMILGGNAAALYGIEVPVGAGA